MVKGGAHTGAPDRRGVPILQSRSGKTDMQPVRMIIMPRQRHTHSSLNRNDPASAPNLCLMIFGVSRIVPECRECCLREMFAFALGQEIDEVSDFCLSFQGKHAEFIDDGLFTCFRHGECSIKKVGADYTSSRKISILSFRLQDWVYGWWVLDRVPRLQFEKE